MSTGGSQSSNQDPWAFGRVAAIVNDGSCDADALLAAAVCGQQAAGRRVRGLVAQHADSAEGCAKAMVLVDIDTRDEYLVSQALGRGSAACRADPQGFALASQVLRRALDEAPDLVVSNRFGVLEAAGGGFRAELLELISRGLPLLTVVATRHLEAWRHFTGWAAELPAEQAAIDAWLAAALLADGVAAPFSATAPPTAAHR